MMPRRLPNHLIVLLLVTVIALAGRSVGVAAGETLPGPVPAEVLHVIDGDTIEVRARVWLGTQVTTLVRIDGIDTPELRGKCDAEKTAARHAKAYVEQLIGGRGVALRQVAYGKFAGRVVASVSVPAVTADAEGAEPVPRERDVATALIAGGFARPYHGGSRDGWCD